MERLKNRRASPSHALGRCRFGGLNINVGLRHLLAQNGFPVVLENETPYVSGP